MRYLTRHYDYYDLSDSERRKARRRVRQYRRAIPGLSLKKARKTAADAAYLESGFDTPPEINAALGLTTDSQ